MFSRTIDARTMRSDLLVIAGRHAEDHIGTIDGNANGRCTYVITGEDGNPVAVCIIGKWFESKGLLGLLLTERYGEVNMGEAGYQPNQLSICEPGDFQGWKRLGLIGITVTEDAQRYARYAQQGQDSGLPWPRALAYADARFTHHAATVAADAAGIGFSSDAYPREPDLADFEPDAENES